MLGLAACGFTVGGTEQPDGSIGVDPDAASGAWLPGFTYRKQIHVTAGGTATLASFPVGVITRDAAFTTHARTDGADFVVTSDDAVTPLDSEVADYSSATGDLELWVRIPNLPPTRITLYLYYGGPATSTNATAVWGPQFLGVWHQSDAGAPARDSTAHAHDLPVVGATASPGHGPGRAGAARTYDGIDDHFELEDPADGSLDVDARSFSYSMWVKQAATHGPYDIGFYKGGTSASEPGYCIMLGTGDWEAKIHDGSAFDTVIFGQEPQLRNRWVHLVAVLDRTAHTLTGFTDGQIAEKATSNLGTLANDKQVRIGRAATSNFEGAIDEVRIYDGALSPDWIIAEHANLTDPAFVDVATEQQR